MELRVLRYFVAVAEELNITKAADKLNISQPPLSNQIKALEQELDTVLFIRGKRHLQLTDSGKLLYRRAKEILSLSDKASDEVRLMGKEMNGTISIGLVEGSAPDIASKWIESFIGKYPDIKFRIMDGNSDELIERLRSGLINLAVITAPCDQFQGRTGEDDCLHEQGQPPVCASGRYPGSLPSEKPAADRAQPRGNE